ncbi:MAG: ATP-binding cassette domain-containing protein [Bacteroidaceae bacterium]|nr:ATP-binding cassette domain-containing protein [Bacteroidaceae bacterium]
MKYVIDIHEAVARNPIYRMAEPVDFQLMEGEQLAIVGDNGAGKSMLIDLITGAHPILDDGRGSYLRYDFSPRASKMAYDNIKYITFQDAYDGTEGYYFYQIRYNHTEWDDSQQLFLLSSGELRKYQLKKALEGNPRVLILDNPFIGLDVDARQYLADTLKELTQKTDLQLIIVLSKTDDMPEVITHVVEVKDRRVGKKLKKEDWKCLAVPPQVLPTEMEQAILCLPYEDEATAAIEPGTQQVVDFRKVTIQYGERVILNALDWTVMNGERWALTGPNGSGKSTLLSLVCADNPQAYANDIVLFGRKRGSGESIWDIKRHIGYVSPEMHRAFLRDYPAIDVVASGLHDTVGLYRRPKPEDVDICMFWMDVFGVGQYRDTSMLKLSSGEQRLVLLARAFVKDPSLIILDEPLHGLDLMNRRRVKDVIETFCRRRNKTLIMVTHYQEEFPKCIEKTKTLKSEK